MEELQYLNLMYDLLYYGDYRMDRTGTGTYSKFGYQMRFNLENDTLPLLTSKKVWFKGILHELLWMISGDTNIKYLQDNGVGIWNSWADENGNLDRVYGAQWRDWITPELLYQPCSQTDEKWYTLEEFEAAGYRIDNQTSICHKTIDQLAKVIEDIKTNPYSRRHIVTAWNPGEIDQMALPPCHMTFQFGVTKGKLNCHLLQRSGDTALGIPYNIAFYSLLTHMVAKITGLKAGEFVHTIVDAHLYVNHVDGAKEQLSRTPLYPFPKIKINGNQKTIDDFTFEDFELINYQSHPKIDFGPAAV
ncbi:thymidylate synthase [Caulobacter phage Cr30]|uniref:thymidylate synthase n=1 Tax=Caulobacter phage Cr30 TaxID=1357714 RepID=UPI0004A9B9ED|nr:thymidylate synthase [Caulobacter phage Cr30]AGS80934.1 thymidylate synthase [Caulobacter phage Cr30]